jgi:EF hand
MSVVQPFDAPPGDPARDDCRHRRNPMRLPMLAAMIFAATAATAQAPAAPPASTTDKALQALIAADANKDGAWDKAEWLAAGRREMGFNFTDADRDGRVTRAELQAGVAKARALGMIP